MAIESSIASRTWMNRNHWNAKLVAEEKRLGLDEGFKFVYTPWASLKGLDTAFLFVRAGEDSVFRARLLADPPSAVEEETGLAVPSGFRIEVHEQGDDIGHLVLLPAGRLSDAELGAITGGDMWSSSDTETKR